MSLSEDIKDFALDLGYSKVGITTADGFPDYIAELNSRRDMYQWYVESTFQPVAGANPTKVMPSAKSIIAVIYNVSRESFPGKLVGKIGRHYQARCYLTPRHRIHRATPADAGVPREEWMQRSSTTRCSRAAGSNSRWSHYLRQEHLRLRARDRIIHPHDRLHRRYRARL